MSDSKPLYNEDEGGLLSFLTSVVGGGDALDAARTGSHGNKLLRPFAGRAKNAGDFIEGAAGSSKLSTGLSIASGINSAVTHDPATDGPMAWLERAMVGGADAAWGLLGGGASVADAATGGTISNVLKAGGSSVAAMLSDDFGAAISGDLTANVDSMQNASDAILGGEHGTIVSGLGVWGDAIGQAFTDQPFDVRAGAEVSDRMQSGSEWNPLTHLARAGDGIGDALFGDSGPDMTAEDVAFFVEAQLRTAQGGEKE